MKSLYCQEFRLIITLLSDTVPFSPKLNKAINPKFGCLALDCDRLLREFTNIVRSQELISRKSRKLTLQDLLLFQAIE